jgi:hypothetical protein
MIKPTIFFSHSSQDKEYLLLLKNKILHKTSNTIEIFQSSDGQSIPFGNNWVHKIEENLKNAKLMFVFISPNSLKSNWLYFEAGYSYSKEVRVIPVGINGIDIGQLPPPLNLLQGFNISCFEGINNLIATLNSEFQTSFNPDFNLFDYNELEIKSNNSFKSYNYFEHIDYIETNLSSEIKNTTLKTTVFVDIQGFLKKEGVKFSKNGSNIIHLNGVRITARKNPMTNRDDIYFIIDQLKLSYSLNLIKFLMPIVYEDNRDAYWIHLKFMDNIELLATDFKLSSRLEIINIEKSDLKENLFSYKSLLFTIDDLSEINSGKKGKRLRIVFDFSKLEVSEVFELIDLLFEAKVIWKD